MDGSPQPQDLFLRDHIDPDDIIVASVGGNDIALAPSLMTIISLISVLKFSNAHNVKERVGDAAHLT